jgi:hypothetical protein
MLSAEELRHREKKCPKGRGKGGFPRLPPTPTHPSNTMSSDYVNPFTAYYGVPIPWLGTAATWEDGALAVSANCWFNKTWVVSPSAMVTSDLSGDNSNVLIVYWDESLNGTPGACFLSM